MGTYRHIDDVKVVADFAYEQGVRYRYRLEITKRGASQFPRTACVVMQNPSYAGKDIADKSVQFMERVVFEKQQRYPEFDAIERMVIVNQFARVQTSDFVVCDNDCDNDTGVRNNETVKSALEEAEVVIIAWGKGNKFVHRQNFVYDLLRHMTGKQFYWTSKHPSRGCYEDFILDTPPGIETTAGVCGGAACLAGTRIPVWILEQYRRSGASEAELLRSYPGLRAKALVHAWAYVCSHRNEIEQHIRENEAA